VIGEVIRRVPARKFIRYYESVLKNHRSQRVTKAAKPKAAKTTRAARRN